MPTSFFPIIFYDWDGRTLLGSKIVGKVEDEEEQRALIERAMEEMAEEKSATAEQLNGELWYDDEELPLTNKRGYSFGKWIEYDAKDAEGNEVYTNYGMVVAVTNGTELAEDLAEPAGYEYKESDRESGITVKAAYKSNADLEEVRTDNRKWDYSVEAIKYLQFAASTNYSVTVRVKREQESEGKVIGVPRARELGLVAKMKIVGSSEELYTLQRLENRDEVEAEIAVNGQVSSFEVYVVDLCDNALLGGTSNWATGAAVRSVIQKLEIGGGHEAPGFKQLAGVGYVNSQCELAESFGDSGEDIRKNQSKSKAALAGGNYTTADLDYSKVAKGTANTPVARRRDALANIVEMYQSISPRRALSWDEMQQAITHGTIWKDGGWMDWSEQDGGYIPSDFTGSFLQ